MNRISITPGNSTKEREAILKLIRDHFQFVSSDTSAEVAKSTAGGATPNMAKRCRKSAVEGVLELPHSR
jgi:hypothetical protein